MIIIIRMLLLIKTQEECSYPLKANVMSFFIFRPITDPAYEDVNNAFERSLVFMHKVKMM